MPVVINLLCSLSVSTYRIIIFSSLDLFAFFVCLFVALLFRVEQPFYVVLPASLIQGHQRRDRTGRMSRERGCIQYEHAALIFQCLSSTLCLVLIITHCAFTTLSSSLNAPSHCVACALFNNLSHSLALALSTQTSPFSPHRGVALGSQT